MSEHSNSRRDFVKKSLLASAAFSIIPRHVMGGPNFMAPSDQLTKAVIGVGGMGQGHLGYEGTKLLAICDADGGGCRCAEYSQRGETFIEYP